MSALTRNNTGMLNVSNPSVGGGGQNVISPASAGGQGLAYGGLYLFIMLLYLRPNELYPELFGEFPFAKIVAIGTLLAYVLTKLSNGEKLTETPIELKMVLLILFLGVAFIPAASSSKDSIDLLSNTYSKVVIIFIIFINLVNTRARLLKLMNLTLILGTWIAYDAINKYLRGDFAMENLRIMGAVGGMFSNPNDLAISFDLLIPIAVVLAVINKGLKRIVYIVCLGFLIVGVVVTFSRGGFLGLIASGGLMMWKLGRGKRILTIFSGLIIVGVFSVAMPGSYGNRLLSISSEDKDATGSSWERKELLKRAFDVALHHPVVGVGMNNFHIFSIKEKVAHNSYVEIWAELGLLGFFAYLTLILSPMKSMGRVANESFEMRARAPAGKTVDNSTYFLSVGVQAALMAYLITSFFGSIQYLWHIYILAGYAVALRYILNSEKQLADSISGSPDNGLAVLSNKGGSGALWKSYRLHSAYR